jgi:tetratricopeptide (TPR) repeat protein
VEELSFQLATSQVMLGRILDQSGRNEAGLAQLAQAAAGFSALQASPEYDASALGNLAVVLGDQANALSKLGRHAQALAAAERALAIDRQRGDAQAQAVDQVRIAGILAEQQHYAEAGQRYGQALAAAQAAGDRDLQATILQRQGMLEDDQGHVDEAIVLYQQALGLFQAAGDAGSEMRTANLLGNAESIRGQLAAAAAWYRRASELAGQLNNERMLGMVAQNLGILYQAQAGQPGLPETEREALLRRALASVNESLAIKIGMNNAVGAAASYFQLGQLHLLLDELEPAEQHGRQALVIDEQLGLPDVYKDYRLMAEIARARGDSAAAEEWQAKYEAKLAELEKLHKGE